MKKSKILTLIMVCVMAITSIFSLTACGAKAEDVKKITDAGKIIVGITDYEPMDYKDESGKWIGFDAELAEKFAAQLGVTCEFVEINWNNKVAEIKSGQIDLIWNGMTASKKLGKQIDFSVSYAKNAQVAVVKSSSAIASKADIAAAKVTAEAGSAGETVAEDEGFKNYVPAESQEKALIEVLSGTSEVAIIDITMAQSVIGKGSYADLKIVADVSYGDEIFAVGLRKNSDLKAVLDAFLKAEYANGTIGELALKYGVGINTEALAG